MTKVGFRLLEDSAYVSPGTALAIDPMSKSPFDSMVFAPKTEMDIGTSRKRSSLFVAVTMISSISSPLWALTGDAPNPSARTALKPHACKGFNFILENFSMIDPPVEIIFRLQ